MGTKGGPALRDFWADAQSFFDPLQGRFYKSLGIVLWGVIASRDAIESRSAGYDGGDGHLCEQGLGTRGRAAVAAGSSGSVVRGDGSLSRRGSQGRMACAAVDQGYSQRSLFTGPQGAFDCDWGLPEKIHVIG